MNKNKIYIMISFRVNEVSAFVQFCTVFHLHLCEKDKRGLFVQIAQRSSTLLNWGEFRIRDRPGDGRTQHRIRRINMIKPHPQTHTPQHHGDSSVSTHSPGLVESSQYFLPRTPLNMARRCVTVFVFTRDVNLRDLHLWLTYFLRGAFQSELLLEVGKEVINLTVAFILLQTVEKQTWCYSCSS